MVWSLADSLCRWVGPVTFQSSNTPNQNLRYSKSQEPQVDKWLRFRPAESESLLSRELPTLPTSVHMHCLNRTMYRRDRMFVCSEIVTVLLACLGQTLTELGASQMEQTVPPKPTEVLACEADTTLVSRIHTKNATPTALQNTK